MAATDLEARRAGMIAYLEARRAERDAARDARRGGGHLGGGAPGVTAGATAAGHDATVPAGDSPAATALPPDQFWTTITERAQTLRATLDAAAAGGPLAEDAGAAAYAGWHAALASLQATLNASATGLPPYDVRKAQTTIDALGVAAEETRGRIMPRKRFAFSKRPLPAARGQPAAPQQPAATTASTPAAALATDAEEEDEFTIRDRSGETVVVTPAQLAAHYAGKAAASGSSASSTAAVADLRLLGLTDCTVLLLAPMRALRVDRLVRCTVLAGPVAGSLLLHDCADSLLAVASRQVRLHRSTRCELLLRPCSRPIIEHCTALRFGPCGLAYPALGEHMAASGLGPALAAAEARGGSGAAATAGAAAPVPLWLSVDDFDWLKLQASPNWTALPREAWPRVGSGGAVPNPGGSPPVTAALAATHGLAFDYSGSWIGDGGGDAAAAAPVQVAQVAPAAAAPADAHDDDEL